MKPNSGWAGLEPAQRQPLRWQHRLHWGPVCSHLLLKLSQPPSPLCCQEFLFLRGARPESDSVVLWAKLSLRKPGVGYHQWWLEDRFLLISLAAPIIRSLQQQQANQQEQNN